MAYITEVIIYDALTATTTYTNASLTKSTDSLPRSANVARIRVRADGMNIKMESTKKYSSIITMPPINRLNHYPHLPSCSCEIYFRISQF